jgi:hypothetical protein
MNIKSERVIQRRYINKGSMLISKAFIFFQNKESRPKKKYIFLYQVVRALFFYERRKGIIEEVMFCKVSRKFAVLVNGIRLLLKQTCKLSWALEKRGGGTRLAASWPRLTSVVFLRFQRIHSLIGQSLTDVHNMSPYRLHQKTRTILAYSDLMERLFNLNFLGKGGCFRPQE